MSVSQQVMRDIQAALAGLEGQDAALARSLEAERLAKSLGISVQELETRIALLAAAAQKQ